MRFKTVFIILLLSTIVLGVKILFLKEDVHQNKSGKSDLSNTPIDVAVYIAKAERIENKLSVAGTVLANEEADIVPEVSGKIVNINLHEGSPVVKGELLVKLSDADLQVELKKLNLQKELAEQKESRQKKLIDINAISKEEYEITLNQLNSAHADIEFTQAQINKTEIRAPFSGVIGLKNVSEGSFVSPAIKIATIQQVDPVKIDFSVPEKYALLVKAGNAIHFSIEGQEGLFEAKIIAVEPKIDITTRTVKARAICPNKGGKIIPGSFAKTEIILTETENSIRIPSEALIPVLKGYKVFVNRNNKAEEIKVTIGLRTDKNVQILQGLKAGDTVLTTGIMQLKADVPVKITGWK